MVRCFEAAAAEFGGGGAGVREQRVHGGGHGQGRGDLNELAGL